MRKGKTNPHRGGNSNSFLEDEGTLQDVTMAATKRVLAHRVLAPKSRKFWR